MYDQAWPEPDDKESIDYTKCIRCGKEAIGNTGVYKGLYLSPVFLFDIEKSTTTTFHILSLEGLGLTDCPNIPAMRRLDGINMPTSGKED